MHALAFGIEQIQDCNAEDRSGFSAQTFLKEDLRFLKAARV
jgi:hypothetical protein